MINLIPNKSFVLPTSNQFIRRGIFQETSTSLQLSDIRDQLSKLSWLTCNLEEWMVEKLL